MGLFEWPVAICRLRNQFVQSSDLHEVVNAGNWLRVYEPKEAFYTADFQVQKVPHAAPDNVKKLLSLPASFGFEQNEPEPMKQTTTL